jgi:uncharacterized protein (TIGR00304 family)
MVERLVDLVTVGVAVILAGILLVFLAAFLGGRSEEPGDTKERTEVRGGGVVLIGPIPIIFGTDAKWASIAIVLAIILALVSFFVAFYGGR